MGQQNTSQENQVINLANKRTHLQSYRNLAHATFKSIRGSAKANPAFVAERQERLAAVERQKVLQSYSNSDQRK